MKKRYPLFWKLYPSFLLMMLIPLLTESGYATYSMRRFFLEQTATHLEISANLLKEEAIHLLSAGNEAAADRLCKRAGKSLLPAG
jgi:two-component system phosphate regulon sensor histidine kinase PhoR